MKKFEPTPEFMAEYERCTNDPLYFYNKYVNQSGRDITQKEYDALVKAIEQGTAKWIRTRAGLSKPLIPSECFYK
jgi:hypothetical protein